MSGDSLPATFSASTARVTGVASRCLESLHFHFGARAIFPLGWMARSAAVGRPAWVVLPFVEPTMPRVSILHTCVVETLGHATDPPAVPTASACVPFRGGQFFGLPLAPRFVSSPPPPPPVSLCAARRATGGAFTVWDERFAVDHTALNEVVRDRCAWVRFGGWRWPRFRCAHYQPTANQSLARACLSTAWLHCTLMPHTHWTA